jgi:arginyl-tRNA--protein-N-Asp/Glu arginylyltransferase
MHYKNNFRPLQLFINEQWQLRNIDAWTSLNKGLLIFIP